MSISQSPIEPSLHFESAARASGHAVICGVDEAGRGPWAGPVVASAVILNWARIPAGLNDSKKLTAATRERLYPEIMLSADVGVGMASAREIDEINILQATYLAMNRAVTALKYQPTLALIDGNRGPQLFCAMQMIIGGDGLSLSIAAASIIAKVTRDRLMIDMDRLYPAYGFAQHKGYGTADHAAALEKHGACLEHRNSFAPVRAWQQANL